MSGPIRLPDNVLHWIAASVLIAAAPHAPRLPPWITLLIIAALALRLLLRRPPGRWLLVPTVVLTMAAVLVQFRTLSGTEAGGAFFAAMVALKFLETRDRRDAGLMICLTYFLATSIFLSNQSIPMAAWVLLSTLVTTTALITLAAPSGPPAALRARRAGVLLLQALPIMLVLFILFPRFSGPLWGIQQDTSTARTGLDDSMSPGSISNLLVSSEVAFRVQFDGPPPPATERYWRGPVLWHYDGRSWTPGKRLAEIEPRVEFGETIDYTLILEPHGRPWVLALDLPTARPAGTALTSGNNLVSRGRIDSVRRYRLRSAREYRLEPSLPSARRLRALQLPSGVAPRARALAREWAASERDPARIVQRALRLFRDQPFVYTLSPPRLPVDPVDQFLFDSRRGFCEHYAGSFVFLMRAAGVPARVVTGYQGGAINRLGEYMIVRQSDAHAWAEVWMPREGWVRVDPTSAVSPLRIERGIGNVAGAADRLEGLSLPGSGLWREAALVWDSINHGWNRLVLGYGPELQDRLLRHLGLDALGRYALVLVMMVTAALALAAVWLLSERLRPRGDPVQREWRRVQKRLRHSGIVPRPTEGASTLARRVAEQRPDLAPSVGRIARLYNAMRYGPRDDGSDLERLRREVAHFRPRRQRAQRTSAAASTADSDSSNR